MRKIFILFLSLLVLQVLSIDEDEAKYYQDTMKCSQANSNPYAITTETCTRITPTLEAGGKFKGKCCKITANYDPLSNYKQAYHENWKKTVCQLYGVDENISDDELRKVVVSYMPKEKCSIILDSSLFSTLYTEAMLTIEEKINYNCGDGDKTFSSKNYYPRNDEERITKDILDCNNNNINYIENTCYKQGNKLNTNKVQCCWCETTHLNQQFSAANSKVCQGYQIDNFKETLDTTKEKYKASGMNVRFKCKCSDKDGNMRTGSFDTTAD